MFWFCIYFCWRDICLSFSPFSFFLLFFSSYFFLLSCFKFIKIFSCMLNPIGFIVLPFRLRFIIRLEEDEVMVEVKFYLFFFLWRLTQLTQNYLLRRLFFLHCSIMLSWSYTHEYLLDSLFHWKICYPYANSILS